MLMEVSFEGGVLKLDPVSPEGQQICQDLLELRGKVDPDLQLRVLSFTIAVHAAEPLWVELRHINP